MARFLTLFFDRILTEGDGQFHVVIIRQLIFDGSATLYAFMQENKTFFSRLSEANGLHQCLARGGSIPWKYRIQMPRGEAMLAMISAAPLLRRDFFAAVSALKSFVDDVKIHA